MNKLIKVVAAPVCAVSLSALAAEAPEGGDRAAAEAAEDESPSLFEAGFDFDFLSAYVWRNAVQTDELVMQPCVWADLTALDPFWIGFSIWQNYGLTDRRRDVYRHGLDETDYNVHAGVTAWSSEDEDWSLDLEAGHDWYAYQGVRAEERSGFPDTREVYVKATLANPFVDIYGQASWMYGDFGDYQQAMHYEVGFSKEVELTDALTLGADWNVNFGDGRYLSYLYCGLPSGAYDHSDDPAEPDVYDDYANSQGGIGGTTLKVYLTYDVTDWLQVGATLAYTGLLNGDLRDSYRAQGVDAWYGSDNYPRDLLWGGLSLKLSY